MLLLILDLSVWCFVVSITFWNLRNVELLLLLLLLLCIGVSLMFFCLLLPLIILLVLNLCEYQNSILNLYFYFFVLLYFVD